MREPFWLQLVSPLLRGLPPRAFVHDDVRTAFDVRGGFDVRAPMQGEVRPGMLRRGVLRHETQRRRDEMTRGKPVRAILDFCSIMILADGELLRLLLQMIF